MDGDAMTPELQAAVVRWRQHRSAIADDPYADADTERMDTDLRLLADAYIDFLERWRRVIEMEEGP